MKADKTPEKPKDEMSQRLAASLRKSRPRRLRIFLVALAAALAVFAFVAWLAYRPAGLPPLHVIAFDQVGVLGKEITLHGRLELPPGAIWNKPLKDIDLIFEEAKVILGPADQPKHIVVKSGGQGEAACPWQFPDTFTRSEFVVRHIGTRQAPGDHDRGAVFLWPAESRLALVQVEQTLTQATDAMWEKGNILDIAPADAAAQALQAIEAARYRIVYLALGTEGPVIYQKLRGWVKAQARGGASRFPEGPVLVRFLPGTEDKPWKRTALALKESFAAAGIAVVGSKAAAEELLAAGFTVNSLGPEADAPGVRRVRGWAELGKMFAK